MKKTLLLSMLALSAMSMNAQENAIATNDSTSLDTSTTDTIIIENHPIEQLRPTYLSNKITSYGWDSNWFVEAKGGATTFLGTPMGCGDVFDRTTPVLQVGIGKWFTPSVGGRIEFQGFEFKNANLEKMRYQFVHADFMYNLTSSFMQDEDGISRLDVIPYAGVGMIHNSDWTRVCQCPGSVSSSHPFAFSYGVQVRYHIQKRMHLIAEVSGMSTLRNFDAVSTSAKFGDNMLNVSAGLSFTFGKVGSKKIIDARPYIQQNRYLMSLHESNNSSYQKQHHADYPIKGQYNVQLNLRNNYSGLNSLRKRMAEKNMDVLACKDNAAKTATVEHSDSFMGKPTALSDSTANSGKNNYSGINSLRSRITDSEAGQNMNDGNERTGITEKSLSDIASSDSIGIGIPVYFYFKINSHNLVDDAQSNYLDEIARIAKESGMIVSVIGAADSATGTPLINARLSKARASFIAEELIKRGVNRDQIKTASLGGISEFSQIAANRYSRVVIE